MKRLASFSFKKIFSRILTAVILLTLGLPCRAANAEFSDVPANSWYADAVTFCRENGLMSGVESGRFAPNGTASRAMLTAVLYRRAGSPATAAAAGFSDVPLNAYYKNAVDWGFSTGLIAGYGNERFGPADPVTREQLAAFLWRAEGRPAAGQTQNFTDAAQISSYAVSAVNWAREKNIISGKGNNRFDPKGLATRGEMASMLARWVQSETETPEPGPGPGTDPTPVPDPAPTPQARKISVRRGGSEVIYELNDSTAANSLYEQLPMTISVENYSTNEKIFYPAQRLDTTGTPLAKGGAGTLAYYAPWGDVVLFYGDFQENSSLFELGKAVSGQSLIGGLQGAITIKTAGQPDPTPIRGKTLIAYFSCTGSTERIAGHLQTALPEAELYEIVPQIPYTAADLDYSNASSRTSREQNDPTARPAISGQAVDPGQYDVVFLGYPIWHGQAPKIISTFLESYELAGKTIVPFCTSASSPMGSSAANLHALAPDAAWETGRRFSGSAPQSAVQGWIDELRLP